MPQNATQSEEREVLAPQQINALERLLAGETITAAAGAVKVDRGTVHRWMREDFMFQAALNRMRRELIEAVQARLLKVAYKAAEVVENEVDQGNLAAALVILKRLGLSGTAVSPGSENPEVLKENTQLAREESELLKA